MFWSVRILSKALVLIFIITGLAWLNGCAPVQRWERGYLSDPMMLFNADAVETNVHQLIYDAREGSSGGYGSRGGGCACTQ
ncbi:DUF4266 domain-containing protein [Candidatus Poribacteria bacterium]|nr:DUF4266 domain-containing protein [Candidatus Poribacteria bacterium]